MVRHIVFWEFDEKFTQEEKKEYGLKIKEGLEGVKEHVEGAVHICVTVPLSSGGGDLVLNSVFEDKEALARYQEAPSHLVAKKLVHSVMKKRYCVDFEE